MDCPTGAEPAAQEHFSGVDPACADVAGASVPPGGESWRGEVAVRLERYRARRAPRAPRYPSLFLPFDSGSNLARLRSETNLGATAGPIPALENGGLGMEETPGSEQAPSILASHAGLEPEPAANIIEFPRCAAIPVAQTPELAEPLVDRPRIVEAPEVLPPLPALGGILMEPAATKEESRRGADFLQFSASVPQRLLAGLLDGMVLGSGLAVFAAVFLHLTPARAPLPVLITGLLLVAVLLWAAYEFLFVVYTGSTPGLRVLRLRLVRFDGSLAGRRTRRWRVLASFLSASSLGLGYLWSVLDENGLCWHDRISHTHIQSRKQGQ